MPGHGEPDGDEGGLHMLHHHLGQAMEHLARHLNRARGASHYAPEMPGAQNTPFPPAQPAQPMPPQGTADQPYGAPRHPHHGYAAGQTPVQYAQSQPQVTITGQPVGQQLEIDKLRYQINEQNRVLQVVLYERDQSDTAACEAEVSRLAAMGYMVDTSEVAELKARPPQERPAYILKIMAKYQKVGTEQLPQILGDPTSQQVAPENRPANKEEMEAALRLTSQGMPYEQALQAVRYQGGQPQPQVRGTPYIPGMQGPAGPAFVYGPHGPQPVQAAFGDPYPEPSANGQY